MHWDVYHPERTVSWVELGQNLFKICAQGYTEAAAWLFVLCGHLLIIYQHQQAVLIRNQSSSNQKKMLVKCHAQLCQATELLNKIFRWILFANICSSGMLFLSSFYFAVEFYSDQYFITMLRQCFYMVVVLCRLGIVCNTADHLRNTKV